MAPSPISRRAASLGSLEDSNAKRPRSSSHPEPAGFRWYAPSPLQTSFVEGDADHLLSGKQSPSPAGVEQAAQFSRSTTPLDGQLQGPGAPIAPDSLYAIVVNHGTAPIAAGPAEHFDELDRDLQVADASEIGFGDFPFIDNPDESRGDSFMHLGCESLSQSLSQIAEDRAAELRTALSQSQLSQQQVVEIVNDHFTRVDGIRAQREEGALDNLIDVIYQETPAPAFLPFVPTPSQHPEVVRGRAASFPLAITPAMESFMDEELATPKAGRASPTSNTSVHLTELMTLLKLIKPEGVPSLSGWIETLKSLGYFRPRELAMLELLRDRLTAKKVTELEKHAHSQLKKDLDFQNEFIRQVFAWSGRKAAGGSQDEKDREIMLKMVLWTTVVIAAYPSYADVLISLDTFRRTYEQQMGIYEKKLRKEVPRFGDFLRVSLQEEGQVLQYCNVVRVGLEIMPFHQNQHTLHSIAVLIEQSGARHTLGGSLGKEVAFRKAVLRAEGAKQSAAYPQPIKAKRAASI